MSKQTIYHYDVILTFHQLCPLLYGRRFHRKYFVIRSNRYRCEGRKIYRCDRVPIRVGRLGCCCKCKKLLGKSTNICVRERCFQGEMEDLSYENYQCFFSVQFRTKCAIPKTNVQFIIKNCAVDNTKHWKIL